MIYQYKCIAVPAIQNVQKNYEEIAKNIELMLNNNTEGDWEFYQTINTTALEPGGYASKGEKIPVNINILVFRKPK